MDHELMLELFTRVKELELRVERLETPFAESAASARGVRKESRLGIKYRNLTRYLKNSGKEREELSFLELEEILGFSLPPSAYRYREFWANTERPLSNAWMSAGYRLRGVDIRSKTLVFEQND